MEDEEMKKNFDDWEEINDETLRFIYPTYSFFFCI